MVKINGNEIRPGNVLEHNMDYGLLLKSHM